MVIVIVRFHNPKIHLVRNPQVVLFTTYDPHLVRIDFNYEFSGFLFDIETTAERAD